MDISATELRLIKDYILLPIVISIVNKNRLEMVTSTATLRKFYAAAALIVMNRMRDDLDAVRRQLKELDINVIDSREISDNEDVHYQYVLRGQQGRFTMRRDAIRVEVGRRLSRYIAEVMNPEVFAHDRKVRAAGRAR